MRLLQLLSLIILGSFQLSAQITLEANSLPKAGDILDYQLFIDHQDTSSYRVTGENMAWSFTGFNVVGNTTEVYTEAEGTAIGDTFPEADMILAFNGFEAAAIRTDNSIEVIGVNGGDLGAAFGVDVDINLDDNFVVAQRPMTYGDSFSDAFDVQVVIDAALIPFLDSLGLPITPDSIRLTSTFEITEEVVGWGTATVFDQTVEVLQVMQTETNDTEIEIGVNFLGTFVWTPITDFLGGLGGGLGGGIGGAQEVTTYKFLSADSKESFIEFDEINQPDSTGMSTMLVVNGRISAGVISNIKEVDASVAYQLYPNPAPNHFIITEPTNSAALDLYIYDLTGRQVHRDAAYKVGASIDVSLLDEGFYLVKFNDGSKDYSSRLQVIK